MSKFYTGVGSRETPFDILSHMTMIAQRLQHEYILRSGGAQGADSAFEDGAKDNKEIFYASDATTEAMEIAKKFHPAWNRCSAYARKLHGRNAFQVLGRSLDTPSKFLICWTPDGCVSHKTRSINTGGTGTAISIAEAYGVKIFNLKLIEHKKYWLVYVIGKLVKGLIYGMA